MTTQAFQVERVPIRFGRWTDLIPSGKRNGVPRGLFIMLPFFFSFFFYFFFDPPSQTSTIFFLGFVVLDL